MVKSRRTRKNEPQVIVSSGPVKTVSLDNKTFGEDIEHEQQNQYANQLILAPRDPVKTSESSDKHAKTGKHATAANKSKPLSKRQRKQLERYLEKSKKRSNRGEVLAQLQDLQKNQLLSQSTPQKLRAHGGVARFSATVKTNHPDNGVGHAKEDAGTTLLSISQAQTKGLKRQRVERQQANATKVKKPKQEPLDDAEDVENAVVVPPSSKNLSNMAKLINVTAADSSTAIVHDILPDNAKKQLENELSKNSVSAVSDGELAVRSSLVENDDADEDRNPNAEFDYVRKLREKKSEESFTNPFRVETYCSVQRTDAMQASRMQLPIIGYEQQIMELIAQNEIIVICGETGSGKTTQLPQFLYESGYASGAGIIGITEPRRVAAISVSQRVADEMNFSGSRVVAYHIRYETNVSDAETKIKFMTDGVLLRELSQDFLLMKYSCIVLDEAHERSSFTDILIGLLSRIVRLRTKRNLPLKLVIMSATLRVEDFTQNARLFPAAPPPVLHVQARQYDVQLHYNKRTPENYLLAAYKKTCKIHQELPAGSILIFVTGQQEVNTLCRWLKQTFHDRPLKINDSTFQKKPEKTIIREDPTLTDETVDGNELNSSLEEGAVADDADANLANLNNYSVEAIDEDDDRFVSAKQQVRNNDTSTFDFGSRKSMARAIDNASSLLHAIDDEEEGDDGTEKVPGNATDDDSHRVWRSFDSTFSEPLRVLPLYSLLSTDRQQQVFEASSAGVRTCVVATNVAETSLTLPGVRYVVDCGKVKAKLYDPITGASTFNVMWTSKASAEQRSGRAGRVSSGHCYRLYSSAVYNDEFEQYTPCEIVRRPIPDLVLQMKAMHIIKVDNFPFPTPPNSDAVRAAERELVQLGALTFDDERDAADGQEEKSESGLADVVAHARVDAVAAIARAQNVSQSVLRRRVAKAKQQTTAAVQQNNSSPRIARITPLGQAMAQIPLMPRYSKALVLAVQKAPDLLPYLIAVVSALTVPEVLMDGANSNDDLEANTTSNSNAKTLRVLKLRWVSSSHQTLLFGDLGVLLKAVGGAEYAGCSREWCETHCMRYKAMLEIRHLRHQLTSIVGRVFADDLKRTKTNAAINGSLKLEPPTDAQLERMRQIMLKSMPFQLARRADANDLASYEQSRQPTAAKSENTALTQQDLQRAYKCIKSDEFVFIHPASVLSSSSSKSFSQLPQFVLFQDLFESKGKRRRLYCRHVTVVEPDWLPTLAPEFCHFEEMVKVDPVSGTSIDLKVDGDALHDIFDDGSVFFDPVKGKVMCRRRCTWGPLSWPMSKPAIVSYAESVERTKLFAAFFIRGDVFGVCMKKHAASLKWPANVMLKSWSKLLPHTQALMQALTRNGADSRMRVESVWRGSGKNSSDAKPVFLLEEYLMWLPEHLHGAVKSGWPPIK